MERDRLDRLLAEYATGGLSVDDRKKLFTAALADQELFDRLTEEDALREAIEMPGARNRLIESLVDESEAAVLRLPPPKARYVKPIWLAWAAGIGIVFVSGAITYMMFETPASKNVAYVRSEAPRDTKPFVAPPSPVKKQLKIIVEAPPTILAESRQAFVAARPVNIPLPTAPPPAEPVPAKDAQSSEVFRSTRAQQDRVELKFRPDPEAPAASPPLPIRRQAGSAGAIASNLKTERTRESKPVMLPSLWRRSADGVWFRVPAADAIGRNDSVVVRYVPIASTTVVLLDPDGGRVAAKPGRAGEELEFSVTPAILQSAAGDAITLSITEGPRSTSLKILLR